MNYESIHVQSKVWIAFLVSENRMNFIVFLSLFIIIICFSQCIFDWFEDYVGMRNLLDQHWLLSDLQRKECRLSFSLLGAPPNNTTLEFNFPLSCSSSFIFPFFEKIVKKKIMWMRRKPYPFKSFNLFSCPVHIK